ncbi:MAG: SGNH/GDSL hydrolase family protein [Planctomycetota bacterium]
MIRPGDTVLFQGDSITDAGRDRGVTEPNDPAGLGQGYARDATAMLLAEHGPDAVRCLNRGIGGDRIHELAARWDADCLALKPTVLSLLIGVNDVWHGLGDDPSRGVSAKMFAAELRRLLSDAKEKLGGDGGLRLIVLAEPFVLPCGAGATLPFEPELSARRALVREIAEGLRANGPVVFVAYQEAFNAAMDRGIAPEHLAGDGVHPTLAGHMLMAEAWMDAVRQADGSDD